MLPRGTRLRRDRDFQAVYRFRKSWATPHLVLYVRFHARVGLDGMVPVRVGFVISKKVAKRAHDRNRLKRRLREITRGSILPRMRPDRSWDALFVARTSATALDFAHLTTEVEMLVRQAGLIPPMSGQD